MLSETLDQALPETSLLLHFPVTQACQSYKAYKSLYCSSQFELGFILLGI